MAVGGASGSFRAQVFRRRRARAHLLWLTALFSFACGGEANRGGASPLDSDTGGSSSGGKVLVTGGAVGAGGRADTGNDGVDVAGAAGALGTCPSYSIDLANCGAVRLDLRQHALGACAFVLDPPPSGAGRNTLTIDCEVQDPVGASGGWHLEPGELGPCGQFGDPGPDWSPDKGIVLVLEGDVCDAALHAQRIDMFYVCPCLL